MDLPTHSEAPKWNPVPGHLACPDTEKLRKTTPSHLEIFNICDASCQCDMVLVKISSKPNLWRGCNTHISCFPSFEFWYIQNTANTAGVFWRCDISHGYSNGQIINNNKNTNRNPLLHFRMLQANLKTLGRNFAVCCWPSKPLKRHLRMTTNFT